MRTIDRVTLSITETAAALGVSQMQVSRLERKAIALLREKREEIL